MVRYGLLETFSVINLQFFMIIYQAAILIAETFNGLRRRLSKTNAFGPPLIDSHLLQI